MYFDWTYLLVLIGMGLSLLASAKVKSTYAKYEKVRSLRSESSMQMESTMCRSSISAGI